MAHESATRSPWYLETRNQRTGKERQQGAGELYAAFELSKKTWRIHMSSGGKKKCTAEMVPGDRQALHSALGRARRSLGLADDSPVVSCMEVGRDGFWPHHLVVGESLRNVVIDASSVKVSRRRRRRKNDRIDADKLLSDLERYSWGDDEVWRVVRVPSRQDESDRQLHRELEQLKKERTQHRNRIRALLATEGVTITGNLMKAIAEPLELRNWDSAPLSREMVWRLERKRVRLQLVETQIQEIERYQRECAKRPRTAKQEKVKKLVQLRGIGTVSAWLLVMESLGWREFENRKQVGGSVGLGGTPYDSGESSREQGISKAGSARIRSTLIELAWLWIRYQPDSDITTWFKGRYGGQSKRARRVGIVAVARRLMIQLWHYLEHDVDPPGAIIVNRSEESDNRT